MQRQTYPPIPAKSPPLHHPVPQHVSTVPMMRSPPPPASIGPGSNYGSPYGGVGGGGGGGGGAGGPAGGQMNPSNASNLFGGPFNNFVNDQTAAMGFHLAGNAAQAGQAYMEQNLKGYISVTALKHYFNVTTSYTLQKLFLVLFPWRHKPWSRQQRPAASSSAVSDPLSTSYSYYFLPPREDLNSPDMYIPVMAFVTYILLSTLLAGLRGAFHPEVMGSTFGYALFVVVVEILILKLGTYILSITNESQLLDLVAYSGYKFVGVIVTLVVSETVNLGKGTGGWVGWTVFVYTFLANAFFLLRSLKYVLLPDSSAPTSGGMQHTIARSQRTRRTQFLFVYAYIVQFLFMWILSRQDSATGRAGKV